jgi:hypothetical protein
MSPSDWMNNILQENDQFASFQMTFAPDPGTVDSLAAWAQSLGYDYLEGYTTTTPPIVDSGLSAQLAAGGLAAAAPEPSTWTMLLLGLAGVGFVRHRRLRSTPANGAPASTSRRGVRPSFGSGRLADGLNNSSSIDKVNCE